MNQGNMLSIFSSSGLSHEFYDSKSAKRASLEAKPKGQSVRRSRRKSEYATMEERTFDFELGVGVGGGRVFGLHRGFPLWRGDVPTNDMVFSSEPETKYLDICINKITWIKCAYRKEIHPFSSPDRCVFLYEVH